ncbi:hypothetical protein Dimus_028129 [Dionaea muscipula]
MAAPFQVATLVASPLYPNAIAWSEENLIAVATDHMVTILNPDRPHSPRGVITLTVGTPFSIGVIDRKDLAHGCLLPTCLSRDQRPCARSIAWSPVGFAANGGCLLALSTVDGRVKIYRQPYCEYQAEWIEVIDISEVLYQYFAKTNYGEQEAPSSVIPSDETDSAEEKNSSRRGCKRRRVKGFSVLKDIDDANTASALAKEIALPSSDTHEGSNAEVLRMDCHQRVWTAGKLEHNSNGKNLLQIFPAPKSNRKNSKNITRDSSVQFITADQYANRSALLASLVVAWSPVLQSPAAPDSSYSCCCLLAVGAKGGKVSIWKVQRPVSYSVEQHVSGTPKVMLLGQVQVQSTWVTALTWGIVDSDASNPRLLLATGSADGSVKIWVGFATDVLGSKEADAAPFCLLNEVIQVEPSPVVVLSLMVTAQSVHKILLGVGKGSGTFEVYTINLGAMSLKKVVTCHAHNCTMTGFAWCFDGRLVYSCSQDNSVRGWIIHKGSLCEVPIPPNSLGRRIPAPTDLPIVYDTCNGVAVSPGNLVIGVVRGFDPHALNPMYQARTIKAAVEFFWIGGQQLDIISSSTQLKKLDGDILSEELVPWGSNILRSLKRFQCPDKHLVVWDIMAASLAIQQCAPKFIEHILSRWVVSFPSNLLSSSKCLSSTSFSNVASRQLHLLNIVCRQIILPRASAGADHEEKLWMELLLSSERELRQRLVGFHFAALVRLKATHTTNLQDVDQVWHPVGIRQMLQWTTGPECQVQNQLDQLTSQVKRLTDRHLSVIKRHQIKGNCEADEQCSYCLAPVPFESPEVGLCQGSVNGNHDEEEEAAQKQHKLARCSVSMQLCPPTATWLCVCCQRRASQLAPEQLYKMPCRPQDFVSFVHQPLEGDGVRLKPLCPFCGILLQRLQPGFLLSSSPV